MLPTPGGEDHLLEAAGNLRSSDRFDNRSQQGVVGVAIVRLCAGAGSGCELRRKTADDVDDVLDAERPVAALLQVVHRAHAALGLALEVVRQPTGLVEKLSYGDSAAVTGAVDDVDTLDQLTSEVCRDGAS